MKLVWRPAKRERPTFPLGWRILGWMRAPGVPIGPRLLRCLRPRAKTHRQQITPWLQAGEILVPDSACSSTRQALYPLVPLLEALVPCSVVFHVCSDHLLEE